MAAPVGGTIISSQRLSYCFECNHLPSLITPTIRPHSTISTFQEPLIIGKTHIHRRIRPVCKAADSTQVAASEKGTVPDEEFSLAKVSFGVIGLGGGTALLSYGFGAYFNILPGSEWSALMLTYGFPLAIIGMALKYAELKPVPCLTYSDAYTLREKCATPILTQVTVEKAERSDVPNFDKKKYNFPPYISFF